MKPPKFDYAAPKDLQHALALLEGGGAEARVLAGGQSLMPALNLRLARPSLLVDLQRIHSLRGIRALDDGGLGAGAMARHRDFEMSSVVRERLPLVYAAMPGIAHFPIRSRGTIGGSLAHADPAGDWPALCLACDATFTVTSVRGMRTMPASQFSLGFFTTALGPGEILTEIRFPAWPRDRRWGLQKFARRRGDFAIVGVIAVADKDDVKVVVYGAGDKPAMTRSKEVSGDLPERVAAETAVRGDLHASEAFRKELVAVLTKRALEQALP